MSMVQANDWTDWKRGSGKLTSRGEKFYFEIVANLVREVKENGNVDGTLYF